MGKHKSEWSFEDRVRFNWGYWAARFDAQNDCVKELKEKGKQTMEVVSRAFDRFYFAGYLGGIQGPFDPDSSEPAWLAYKELQKTQAAQRKIIRDMRPSRQVIC